MPITLRLKLVFLMVISASFAEFLQQILPNPIFFSWPILSLSKIFAQCFCGPKLLTRSSTKNRKVSLLNMSLQEGKTCWWWEVGSDTWHCYFTVSTLNSLHGGKLLHEQVDYRPHVNPKWPESVVYFPLYSGLKCKHRVATEDLALVTFRFY